MNRERRVAGSFRDPSGYVVEQGDALYRYVHPSFAPDWDAFVASGLKHKLESTGRLVRSEDADPPQGAHAWLRTERVPFVSYPYEWCFGQLKDAALLTLNLAVEALDFGMVLKDASAFNVQFVEGRPVFIDLLSFERYVADEPWVAYRQFCQHFLAPLALWAHVDPRTAWLWRGSLDGVPLDLASSLLPARTRFSPGLAAHLHLHARTVNRSAGQERTHAKVSLTGQRALLANLRSTVEGLQWRPSGTWTDYAGSDSYSSAAEASKQTLVRQALKEIPDGVCWDLGANNGVYSAIAQDCGFETIAWDLDPGSVEKAYANYRQGAGALPLVLDLCNGSPSLGWGLEERASWEQRGPARVALALALIHHLAIGSNVPLKRVAQQFARVAEWAVVEFVPKEDPQVQRLLASRRDVFPNYGIEGFLSAFEQAFERVAGDPVQDSLRSVWVFRRR